MSSTTGLSAAQRLQQAHEQQQQQQQQQHDAPITQDPFPVLTEDPFPVTNSSSSYSNPINKQQQQQQVENKKKVVNVDDQSAFPSLGGGTSTPKVTGWGSGSSTKIKTPVATASTGTSSNGTITPGGGAGSGDNNSATLSFSIPTSSIHITSPTTTSSDSNGNNKGGRNGLFSNDPRLKSGPPQTLGEVLKYLINQPENLEKRIEIQASSSSKLTTFIIKASLSNNNKKKNVGGGGGGGNKTAQEEVERVKTELLGWLEKKVRDQVKVPKNLRALIIGAKGRTLKGIIDSTGCSIQIPRDEDLITEEETSTTTTTPDKDDSDSEDLGPLISIQLSGPSSAVSSAKSQILSIVREKTSKTSISLPEITSEYWIFLRGRKMEELIERALGGSEEEGGAAKENVKVFVPRRQPVGGKKDIDVEESASANNEESGDVEGKKGSSEVCIKVSGDKDLVKKVVQTIHEEVNELKSTIRPVIFSLPKRQHRFLVGNSISDEILEKTGCAVEVPPQEIDSEDVTVRGPSRETIKAMQLVMDLASATPVEQLDLLTAHRGTHDPRIYARSLSRYLLLKQKLRPIATSTRTKIYLPKPSSVTSQSPHAFLEIVGEKDGQEGMKQARQGVISQVRKLPPTVFETVEIEQLVVRYLREKRLNKVKSLEKDEKVEIFLPREGEGSEVLIVYIGEGEEQQDPKSALEATKQSLVALSSEFADLVTLTLSIPSNLHGAVIGTGGTTLNAVLGEDKLAHVQFGGSGEDVDLVTIRGPKDEAERVKAELKRISEEAKKEEIVNSHLVEFEIETSLVRHVVGKSGSGVNKLREELGVRVDFVELSTTNKKGNKLSKVSIKGRKENVEEAAKRVKGTATRMADEVTLTIPLPSSLDRGSLIGKQGTYLKRLEDKYEVRINFPKSSSSAEESSSSEIVIRGPSKGAQSAKSELVDLISYEKEHGNTLTFSVPSKALSRILGRGGSQINQIKDDTGVASVDIDQEEGEEGSEEAKITLKGTKASIKNARTEIERIAKEVSNEVRIELEVPKEYHTTLIGSGGSSIRDLITRCGGPSDGRASGNMVRFPRQGDSSNTVLIVAPSSIAHKIESELSKEISSLASRVVWGVVVPQPNHAAVIGKGAQNLQETQRKHGVKIYMPGWNDYAQAGEVENKSEDSEVEQAQEKDLVKIVGPKESVLAAAKELQSIKGRASGTSTPTAGGPQSTNQHSVKVLVPKKFHAVVAQGGRFFRSLPNGTRVSHEGVKPPSSTLKAKKPPVSTANGSSSAARIDEVEIDSPSNSTDGGIEFQLVPIHEENGLNGDDEEQDTIPWVIESRNEEDAQKVAEEIRKSLERAKEATHIGWVTVPRGMMPRIVGRGGSGLDRLRSTGVDVEVVGKRDANQLTMTGSPSAIEEARSIIEGLNAPRQRRDRDDY